LLVTSKEHMRAYVRDTQQKWSKLKNNEYIDLETQLLRIIEDSALDGKGVMSTDELTCSLERRDPFTLRMQILTLEGKGHVKKTELGYILTEKGKERLQEKD
jgi:hypothetical protein